MDFKSKRNFSASFRPSFLASRICCLKFSMATSIVSSLFASSRLSLRFYLLTELFCCSFSFCSKARSSFLRRASILNCFSKFEVFNSKTCYCSLYTSNSIKFLRICDALKVFNRLEGLFALRTRSLDLESEQMRRDPTAAP